MRGALGYGYYEFEDASVDNTQEIFAKLAYEGPVDVNLLAAHDFDNVIGNYGRIGLSKDFILINNLGLSFGATVGFNDEYFRDETGFTFAKLIAGVPVKVNDKFKVTPAVTYSKSLASDFDDQFYVSADASYGF